jgi:uncharacterized protein
MEPLVTAIRTQVSADFEGDSTGHDLAHLDRVFGLAEQLRLIEGGDPLVLAGAAYVHDYHRVLERDAGEYGTGVRRSAIDNLIGRTLSAIDFPPDLISMVCDCVEFTDKYSFSGHVLDPPSLEARILRDADNLDALGAVGIARAFMFGGALGEPIWVDGVDPSDVYEAGATTSIVHHFYEKLLRVRDDMLTTTGRTLADERHDFMVEFLGQIRRELDCANLTQRQARQVR